MDSHKMIVELDQYLTAEMRASSEDLDKIMDIQRDLTVDSCKQLCMVYGIKWDVLNRMRNVIWRVYERYSGESMINIRGGKVYEENTNRPEH